jgi:hypothetical protein
VTIVYDDDAQNGIDILADTGTTIPALIGTPVADLATDIAGVQTDTTAIVADTNELQTDWTNGGRLDLLIDAIKVVTDAIPDGGALTALLASIASILADTNELQTDDVPGLIAALNDISVSDVLTTQMTEAYAADGIAPTLAQALFLIQQSLTEFANVGTTHTVKKLDGSTTAATFTHDDAAAPTSKTRTT